jgi:hypothetical protein
VLSPSKTRGIALLNLKGNAAGFPFVTRMTGMKRI